MTTWNQEQLANAKLIISVGRLRKASDRDILIALMTAMQESSLINVKGGDRDSAGLYQQRPSQGWGTYEQVTNPTYAINTFYHRLSQVENRDAMSLTQAAQAVQRSGFPNAYAKWEDDARAIMNDVKEGAPMSDIVSTVESVQGTSKNVEGVFNTLGSSSFWKRAGVVAAGTVMVIAGAVIMLSGTEIAKSGVVGTVAKVATKGVLK